MSKPPADLVIRPPRLDDAHRLHQLRTLPGVMWGTMQIPSMTFEQVRRQMETPSPTRLSTPLWRSSTVRSSVRLGCTSAIDGARAWAMWGSRYTTCGRDRASAAH